MLLENASFGDIDARSGFAASSLALLSPRELEVIQELVDGRGPKEFAQRLYISEQTARTHVKNILSKLGAHSSLEAVSIAVTAGVLPSSKTDGLATR